MVNLIFFYLAISLVGLYLVVGIRTFYLANKRNDMRRLEYFMTGGDTIPPITESEARDFTSGV
jgi:hypothetical protein